MNWTSEEGRALLWRAYPSGMLPMRGCLTVGGCFCLEPPDVDEEIGPTYYSHREGIIDAEPDDRHLLCGDLLPLPDPDDPATWACLKYDLGAAIAEQTSGGLPEHYRESVWVREKRPDYHTHKHMWVLQAGLLRPMFPGIDTEDPAEALVRARVQVLLAHVPLESK